MAVVVKNLIVKNVSITKIKERKNVLQVRLYVKFTSEPVVFELQSIEAFLSLIEICGVTSLEDIKEVPIRIMQISEQCLNPLVAIGHIVSDKWLFFDEETIRGFNYLKSCLAVNEIIARP